MESESEKRKRFLAEGAKEFEEYTNGLPKTMRLLRKLIGACGKSQTKCGESCEFNEMCCNIIEATIDRRVKDVLLMFDFKRLVIE